MHSSSPPPPILEVEDLRISLRGNPILTGVGFAVRPQTIHVIMGPNGAGKTTLMRAILGGMPHEGTIRFNFRDNGRIGYVPQLLEFDHSVPITVGDFINILQEKRPIFLGGAKKRRAKAEEVLAITKTEALIDRQIGNLSGGEFRRVLLAQALSPLPEILLLDEPASNVDELGAMLFEELLQDLCANRGLTILMVAHDISMVLRLGDWVTAINRHVTYEGEIQGLRDPATLGAVLGTTALSIANRYAQVDP